MIPQTNHMFDTNDYYQQWQINKYGNIVTAAGELLTIEEVSEREDERKAEAMNNYYEKQMDDHLNY